MRKLLTCNCTYRKQFQSVLWINCASKASILRDFEAAAQILKTHLKNNNNGPSFESKETSEAKKEIYAVQLVLDWLSESENSRWLLVFDGLDEPKELKVRDYFPKHNAGHIIITSRSTIAEGYAKVGRRIQLELLSPENATTLLLQCSNVAKSLEDVSDGIYIFSAFFFLFSLII